MELVPIFAYGSSGEGLYAIRFDVEEDEWGKIMKQWLDSGYVTAYLLKQVKYLQSDYFRKESIDSLRRKIENEVQELDRLIFDLIEQGYDGNLQQFFKPLDNREYRLFELQKSKGKLTERPFHPSLLRVYALRISGNTYVITGGAIKLADQMEEHEDTRLELQKLNQAYAWLKARNLVDEEAIKEFLYEGEF